MKISFDNIKIIMVYISSAVFSIACAFFIIGA